MRTDKVQRFQVSGVQRSRCCRRSGRLHRCGRVAAGIIAGLVLVAASLAGTARVQADPPYPYYFLDFEQFRYAANPEYTLFDYQFRGWVLSEEEELLNQPVEIEGGIFDRTTQLDSTGYFEEWYYDVEQDSGAGTYVGATVIGNSNEPLSETAMLYTS